ncbi:tripartite ATP-independent transporter solute receptor, DctP family [Alteromonadaceae bacterium Bs31]|nr:tripartite ATP-independent transporter solute receptor, DctP family [Alteromonadaceae bacterium Bs31]
MMNKFLIQKFTRLSTAYRVFRQVVLLGGVALLATACGTGSEVTVLKMSHSLPTDHPVHGGIAHMAERLAELSGGKMRVDIYPGGQLGSEREQIELLQIGSLAMTKVSSSPMESFVPEMKVFSLPYVFRDSEHFWRALNSDIGKQLLLSGERVGLRGLGYYDAGARSFYSVDKPIHTPEDLTGLKVRVQNSNTSVQMVRALGGAGTPIAFGELYTALDQGVVDGAENNPPSFVTSGHFEVAKYYSLTEHTYVPDIVLISSYIWNRLQAQEKNWLQQAMDESIVVQRDLWQQSTQESLKLAQQAGVEIVYPDKSHFSDRVNDMLESLRGEPSYDVKKAFRAL